MKKKFTLEALLQSAYIRMPRLIFKLRYSDDPEDRLLADLYEYLYTQSFFKKGTVDKQRTQLECQRGQIICSLADMSKCLHLKPRKINALIGELKELNLIEVEQIGGISHISIRYYDRLAGTLRDVVDKPVKEEKKPKENQGDNPQRLCLKNHPLGMQSQNNN
mgnify:FL=1